MSKHRLLPLAVVALGVGIAARPAAAQQEPWGPAPAPSAQPRPPEGGGVGLQILASIGVAAAIVATAGGTMWLADSDSRVRSYVSWGVIGVTPAAVGLAVCNLGQPTERREPSCPRAVVAAYIGSLIAVPVFAVAFLSQLHWGTGPNPHETRSEAIIGISTSVAWVGGLALGSIVFGRRRIRPPA